MLFLILPLNFRGDTVSRGMAVPGCGGVAECVLQLVLQI